jgi:peroxiredoxin
MAIRDKHSIYWVTALFLGFVFVLGVLHGCKREAPEPNQPASANDVARPSTTKNPTVDPIQAAANLFREPKPSLQAIIDASKQKWDAVFPEWWGKPAPDFTLADIEGKPHRLSDYRGKDVILVFWATWCGPCKLEIPHLKELRSSYSQDKLAILAVSDEAATLVKSFITEQQINYTILLNPSGLPEPYGKVEFIPSSFFVDPQGNFKLAIRGIVETGDAKAIMQAQ